MKLLITRFAIAAVLVLVLGVLGFLAVSGSTDYRSAKRNVRLMLGLPKFWVNDFNDTIGSSQPLACPKNPLVFASGGQSNAANSYDPAPPADNNANTYMFYNGNCYKLQSPVLGATGDRDSLWPGLADKIVGLTGRPVVFINGAVGGSQIGDWLDDRSHYFERLAHQMTLAERVGLRPKIVFWIQGETDAAVDLDPQLYAKEQTALLAKFDAAGVTSPDTRWLIFLSTRCMHRQNNGAAIEAALRTFVSKSDGRAVLGPEVSQLDDQYRHDTCHLNTSGRDRVIDETMQILSRDGLLKAAGQ